MPEEGSPRPRPRAAGATTRSFIHPSDHERRTPTSGCRAPRGPPRRDRTVEVGHQRDPVVVRKRNVAVVPHPHTRRREARARDAHRRRWYVRTFDAVAGTPARAAARGTRQPSRAHSVINPKPASSYAFRISASGDSGITDVSCAMRSSRARASIRSSNPSCVHRLAADNGVVRCVERAERAVREPQVTRGVEARNLPAPAKQVGVAVQRGPLRRNRPASLTDHPAILGGSGPHRLVA